MLSWMRGWKDCSRTIGQWTRQYSTTKLIFCPTDYAKGELAESWEFTDPSTFVVHLRQGIHWQNIPPANGREFTADDVVFHFDRMFGLGDGFTTAAPPVRRTVVLRYPDICDCH